MSDGKAIFYPGKIISSKKGQIHVDIHDYVLSCPGRCRLDIGIYNKAQGETENKEDEIASTEPFILYIPEEVFNEVNVVESDEGSALSQLINSVRDEIDEMNHLEDHITSNKNERQFNEANRSNAESIRRGSESTRESMEKTRSSAEIFRNNSEQERNNAASCAEGKANDLQNKLDAQYFALMYDLQSHNSVDDSHLADSDDTTLGQLSEIVAYIKSNRDLIENITTGKVNVADIIDSLTSTATNKPLSAKQGKILNDLITALTNSTKNITTGTGQAEKVWKTDASGTPGWRDSGETAKLSNPRTIFGKSFDGSANVTGQALVYGSYNSSTAGRNSSHCCRQFIRQCFVCHKTDQFHFLFQYKCRYG